MQDAYTVAEAAGALRVSESKVRQLIADGHLATVPHLGRRIIVPRREIDRLLSEVAA